jgi:hypothetical protein
MDLCQGLDMKQIVNLVMIELDFYILLMELQLDAATDLIGKFVYTEIPGQIQSKN